MSSIRITAAGAGSVESKGHEVIMLAFGRSGALQQGASLDEFGWREMKNVVLGASIMAPRAWVTESAGLELEHSEPIEFYFLSHPWSGHVVIDTESSSRRVDLYSTEARVVRFDSRTMSLMLATRLQVQELLFAIEAPPLVRLTGDQDITVLGGFRRDSTGDDIGVDLASLMTAAPDALLPASGGSLRLKARRWATISRLKGLTRLVLATGPGAGIAKIDLDGRVSKVDLRASELGQRSIDPFARDFGEFAGRRPAFVDFREDDAPYRSLLNGIDPSQPVALYVPRWKGVASSTFNLFPQRLPIPMTQEGHPDLVTDVDIDRYVHMLRALGARHYVVSGGDTFFIRIIKSIQESDADIRFDLLWHSNYVQMGETHDWRLLKEWLYAHREGHVRRIGVVKEGYEDFLRALGADAIFIPNIVDVDPDGIEPSKIDDKVGVWLSGSTEYRKLPYASLLALAEMPNIRLKASGLTALGRSLVSDLNLPVDKLWDKPIPRALLYQEMADTGATLYITLSECSPMLPLESLGLGVPCLVGPSSHLFRRDRALRDWLVVENPLDASLIAAKLKYALRNRAEIIEQYRSYARQEREIAIAGVAALLH